MKKKIFTFCLAFAMIVPATFMLSACGGNKQPPASPGDSTTDTMKVYDGFVFDDNKMVGYIGESTEITIPTSYSIHNTNSDICTLEYKITDIINYGDETSLDYEIWADDLSNYELFILVGGMYNASVNDGKKEYIRVGEAEEYFTRVKETYTDLDTTITIELSDYVLTPQDQIDESNFTIISRPLIEMISGKLESFSMEYNSQVINFTKENFMQNSSIFEEIYSNGILSSEIKYNIGNYIEFIEGDDFDVEIISSLSPDQSMGGGLFDTPKLTSLTIPESITTISNGVFEGVTTLSTVTIESESIYNSLTDTTTCGSLIANANSIKILKSIVDNNNNANEFLNTTGGYDKTEEADYYVYTKQ